MVPGNAAAVEGKDFIPIKDKLIKFKAGEISYKIELEMPDCELDKDAEEEQIDQLDTVSFALVLENPQPTGLKLSKKSTCFINIEPISINQMNDENQAADE